MNYWIVLVSVNGIDMVYGLYREYCEAYDAGERLAPDGKSFRIQVLHHENAA